MKWSRYCGSVDSVDGWFDDGCVVLYKYISIHAKANAYPKSILRNARQRLIFHKHILASYVCVHRVQNQNHIYLFYYCTRHMTRM